ncbi:MAG: hypothetical protein HY517_01405 [Candidatus Aenigmarchaeota archaeon]|nr:hypothetical protein [Candidatus Aenigmarchaeota archaeon]
MPYEKEFNMRKPAAQTADIVDCPTAPDEVMDPIGYFLIRVSGDKLEAGLCDYDNVNVIKKIWRGMKPQDLYQQIVADNPTIMQVHVGYLAKELTRAWICMKLGVKFVQDGRMDGTFPEVEWLLRKENAPK